MVENEKKEVHGLELSGGTEFLLGPIMNVQEYVRKVVSCKN